VTGRAGGGEATDPPGGFDGARRRHVVGALAGLLAATVAGARRGRPALAQPPPAESPPAGPVNLYDFEALARQRLSRSAFDYVSGGAADEITLRRNREAFDQIRLRPRVLVDVSRIDTRLELLGQRLAFPILLAPTGNHRLFHPDAEAATVRGAGAAKALMVVSTYASQPIEDIARGAPAALWFQLYVRRDRELARRLVTRAEAAGCRAICITVDTPVVPTRDRQRRAGVPFSPELLDPTVTWETVDWVRSLTPLPVLLKGILAPEDARLAVRRGVAGVVVSNHGGRNLDTTPATIEALPAVVAAAEGRIPVLLDGGVRRGTDVVKALALGARAVLIGRPQLWGLAADGADGVARVVTLLRTELEVAMALCGTPTLGRIGRGVLWPGA
jgi:4-hydroxymandelate oxidase